MMRPTSIDPYDFVPPPAYDASDDFDNKVSLATQISLVTPPAPAPELSEERWAEIEEAAFQAAIAASLSEGAGSGSNAPSDGQSSNDIERRGQSPARNLTTHGSPSTQPLRIAKKTNGSVDSKKRKDPPTWLSEAEGRSTAGSGSRGVGGYEGDDFAPPPFTPASARSTGASPTTSHGFARYGLPDSAWPSPVPSEALSSPDLLMPNIAALSLSSSVSESQAYPRSRPQTPATRRLPLTPSEIKAGEAAQGPYFRQSMPTSPSETTGTYRSEQRPKSAISPSEASAPMVPFNPSVAYGKTGYRGLPAAPSQPSRPQDSKPEVFRANAFYNLSVSGHLPQRRKDQRTTTPYSNHQPNSAAPSYNTPVYSQANSPQPSYRNYQDTPGGGGMLMSNNYHHTPAAEQHTAWQPASYQPNSNRPMSIHSVNTVYSNNGITQQQYQPQYLNTMTHQIPQQHSGPTNWMQAAPQRYAGSYR